MRKNRVAIPADLSAETLFASDRTCCVCRERGKRVQIHHIDDDPSNNAGENFAVLCLDCHDQTQLRGGFSKHLTAAVVRKYRDEWLLRVVRRRDEADQFAVSRMSGVKTMAELSSGETSIGRDLFAYLDSTLEIRKALLAKAQPEWDSGVTARMNQATYDYIDGLQGILVGLSAFYSPQSFGDEPHDFFSEIISSRFRWHRAHAEPRGPGTGGTIVGTICGGAVAAEVEVMIVDMVMSLLDYTDEYSWKHWKRRWENR
ncbi:HNH endonuclease [Pseudomonas otitidis]|uniref:HNH endonuclease signature motif containing protein n=1 Tax=Metapseudomonas otitidis TaxID=319939 RepID=UPI00244C0EE8|nr:HNH endonuclease signature motif containing protein [Pseudomonas otitidis]MDH1109502.1 HNH endonuclease [Pseudomonas otitidis]MDH1160402.1 HNH endonuclease [Pseudomonas otitidis]MDH1166495.1 HNH endonuclease [Pseudomonas otitidis]